MFPSKETEASLAYLDYLDQMESLDPLDHLEFVVIQESKVILAHLAPPERRVTDWPL